MSNVSSQIKRLVEKRTASGTADDAGIDTLSRSELKEAVREGVLEALEEHHNAEHEDVDSVDDDLAETDKAESVAADVADESSGGLSLKKLFVYGVVALLIYRRKQSKKTSQTA